eukprot:362478-Chlamydomonas_euryale.AAC.8
MNIERWMETMTRELGTVSAVHSSEQPAFIVFVFAQGAQAASQQSTVVGPLWHGQLATLRACNARTGCCACRNPEAAGRCPCLDGIGLGVEVDPWPQGAWPMVGPGLCARVERALRSVCCRSACPHPARCPGSRFVSAAPRHAQQAPSPVLPRGQNRLRHPARVWPRGPAANTRQIPRCCTVVCKQGRESVWRKVRRRAARVEPPVATRHRSRRSLQRARSLVKRPRQRSDGRGSRARATRVRPPRRRTAPHRRPGVPRQVHAAAGSMTQGLDYYEVLGLTRCGGGVGGAGRGGLNAAPRSLFAACATERVAPAPARPQAKPRPGPLPAPTKFRGSNEQRPASTRDVPQRSGASLGAPSPSHKDRQG